MNSTILASVRPVIRGGTIVVASGEGIPHELTVGFDPKVIGRAPGCAMVLHDKKVSATHLEVTATEQGLRVRDVGSTNGTFLGDLRVHDVTFLKPEKLRCGDTVIECRPGKREALVLSESESFGPLSGATPRMRALFEQLRCIAPTTLSVLIEGETGTGKELVAQAIHQASQRAANPFVVIDCGAIPPQLAESALFGHEKGSFTGAMSKRISPFVEARGGTVFLDELGELPIDLQPKLLRALAEQRIKSVGANAYTPVDVRIVAATRRDLLQEINRGNFRDDLYFRIAEERIELPPLCNRREDIPPLVQRMMTEMGKAAAFKRVSAKSLDQLAKHRWPGNVRELKNLVKRALAYDGGGPLDLSLFLTNGSSPRRLSFGGDGRPKLRTYEQSKEEHDENYFRTLYEATEGNQSEMARQGSVSRVMVRAYVRKYGLVKRSGR